MMRDLTASESAELVAERDRVWPMFAAWFTSDDRDGYEAQHPELVPQFGAFLDRLEALHEATDGYCTR